MRRKVFGALLSACALAGALLLAPGVAQAQTGKYLWVTSDLVHIGTGFAHVRPGLEIPAYTSTTSATWGGWIDLADTGNKFYQSSVQFNVPDSHCPTPDAQAAVWVGLDGATDATVEQAGVLAECVNSVVSYYDWYDMAPNGAVIVNPVSPGDTIVAHANYNPTKKRYYLDIDDESDPAEGFNSPPQACPSGYTCNNSSAEVVVEDAGGSPAGGAYLADFNKANFSNAKMVSASGLAGSLQGNSEWNTEKVTMQYKSYPMVQVGARSDGSTAFTDTWEGPG
jgi:Peptidase A4 family